MRYLGNKTRLLDDIASAAHRLGFERGRVADAFAGSAVVGRHFRGRGCRVESTDLMPCSYVFQRLFLELDAAPDFACLRERLDLDVAALEMDGIPGFPGDFGPASRVLRYLGHELEPTSGLFERQYSPDGEHDRRFFSGDNARRIDAVAMVLRDWRERDWIDATEQNFLLACLIDAADRRANISGTYGAFLKKWQQNALAPLEFRLPKITAGPIGVATCRDTREWIADIDADLLYMDPPYNNRQYAANYHLMNVIALAVLDRDLDALEASIYGKTGLIPWRAQASQLCSRRGQECFVAFREILMATSIPRVVISYSEEGILSRSQLEALLAEYAGIARSRLPKAIEEVAYPRFRSDADGRVSRTGASRQYRRLEGRAPDEVHEWLISIESRRLRRC